MTCCSKDQKVTEMVLKVDLDCCQCYRKVKKVLCKFPQIRNQVFNEKNNTVTITVFCCSPERIRDKLCCKAGKSIKSIEIKEPQKPKQPPAPAQPEKQPPTPDLPKKPKQASAPGEPEKQPPTPDLPTKPKQASASGEPEKPKKAQQPEAQCVAGYPPGPPPQMFPVSVCCTPCSEGRPGGPCYSSGPGPAYPYAYYGRPCPPPPGYYGCRCDYFSEENPAACSIM